MSLSWTDIILNGASLFTTLESDNSSTLGIIDTAFQSASIASSLASATINVAEPNPLIALTTILSGTLAFSSGKQVLLSDNEAGKFSGATGPYAVGADFCTILGDIFAIFGGAAALIGPEAVEASVSANIAADAVTGTGLVLQYEYKHNGSTSTSLLTTLNGGISSLESFVSTVYIALSNANSSYTSEWKSAQTSLTSMLTAISTAANNTDPSTFNSQVDTAIDAINSFQSTISTLFTSVTSDNSSLSSATTDEQSAAASLLIGSYQQSGLYVVQSGDTWDSIASTLTSLGTSIDSGTLQRINAVFGITSASTGTILHVPASSPLTGPSFEALPSAIGFTKVFDISNDALYTVGSGANTDLKGALVIDQADFTGHYPTFDAGTYSSVTLNPNGTVNVDLVSGDPVSLGTLTLASSGSGSLTLNNGVTLSLSGLSGTVTGAPSTDSAEQALIAYLGDLGDSTTASALDTTNIDHLNPTGTTYTVTGSISGSDDTFTLEGATPGASVTGSGGYTNILDVSGDIAQDSISDIQQVHIESALTLNASEWTEFSGDGAFSGFDNALTFASSGTFSISGISAGITSMTAEDWGGTTLTGNGTNGQTLTASLFGNDTLTAGSGTGDTLVAGEGVDTLNGGSGGDKFEAYYGLAAGSSVTGSGSGNVLMVGAGGGYRRRYHHRCADA